MHRPFLLLPAVLGWAAASAALASDPETLWDLPRLEAAPAFRWTDDSSPVRSLLYEGEEFEGRQTEVFAFYASPATLGSADAEAPFPAVVLVHGGGGTAFAEWAWIWARRGYAAIAMDLAGCQPPAPAFDAAGALAPDPSVHRAESRVRLEKGGPGQGHPEKFGSIAADRSAQWPWHAVASVIRAHSLVRSLPEVDPGRTAVTGISWGGYTTCLAASVDHRFRAAVPVYGCGYLHEGESVQKKSIDALDPASRAEWVRLYDPSSHLSRCRVPIFFVNGTHDIHYPLDSYARSYSLVPGEKQIRIEHRMGHSHPAGWAPDEIARFIDTHCRGGEALPRPGEPSLEPGGMVRVTVENRVTLSSATLYYTAEEGPRSERDWISVAARVEGDQVTAPAPPAEANTWFLALTDQSGAMVSTPPQFSRAAGAP